MAAPTETLALTSCIVSEFVLTGADELTAVASPDDDDTSTVMSDDAVKKIEFTIADATTIGLLDTVSRVDVTVRAKKNGIGTNAGVAVTLGDGTNTATVNSGSYSTSYVNRTVNHTTAPDGGAWTRDKLNGLTLLRLVSNVNTGLVITTVTVSVVFAYGYSGQSSGAILLAPRMIG